jgi:hypothetical protein
MAAPATEGFRHMSVLLLSFSHLSTRWLGLDRTVRLFRWAGRRAPAKPGARRPVEDVAAAALRGLNVLPLQIECLDQAIVVWCALNRHAHPAVLKIGMRLSPLSGHAWVSCGADTFVATPGLEDFEVVASYEPWAGSS